MHPCREHQRWTCAPAGWTRRMPSRKSRLRAPVRGSADVVAARVLLKRYRIRRINAETVLLLVAGFSLRDLPAKGPHARHLRQPEGGGGRDLCWSRAGTTIAGSCRCAATIWSSRSPGTPAAGWEKGQVENQVGL